jgi:hypothetical protein
MRTEGSREQRGHGGDPGHQGGEPAVVAATHRKRALEVDEPNALGNPRRLHSNARGLALAGGRARPFLAAGRGLIDAVPHRPRRRSERFEKYVLRALPKHRGTKLAQVLLAFDDGQEMVA